MTKKEIGEKLKAKRISCGMTQQEVAEKIGRKQPIVGHWETGYSQPDANTLFMLCDIYGTTVDDIFGFSPKENFSKSEYDHIKKYRAVDESGREHVSAVLQWESDRMNQLKRITPTSIVELHNTAGEKGRLIEYFRSVSTGTGQVIFDDVYSERITMPDIPKYRRVAYAVKVDGKSMEPLYNDGDILLIEPTCEISIGEIGIFNVNGLAYVKQLGKDRLISLNNGYDDILLTEDPVCMGRVVNKL